ncbi:MAG: beta-propeller fold lactonase family protein [Chitinophagaceae bacterium]|nr:beta-propeller fold lactonase family protein [Chitinophagaceae bacterium]
MNFIAALFVSNLLHFLPSDTSQYQLVVGSYTKKGNPGIEVYSVNAITGKPSLLYTKENQNASYLTLANNGKSMFAVSEGAKDASFVTAYKMGSNNQFEKINQAAIKGAAPCFITFRQESKTVYTANYTSGSLSVFKTDPNGQLLPIAQEINYSGSSINKSRQETSHAHNVVLSPDQSYLLVTDLGADKIYMHKIYADGLVDEKYSTIKITPGNGPRHFVFDKKGNYGYLINELSGTVDVFSIHQNKFDKIQTIIADTSSTKTAKGSGDIHISPSGKWLITTNRVTSEELTIFKIGENGLLSKMYHQPVAPRPRNFSFSPIGNFVFVASQAEDKVQIFAFDDATGKLTDTHQDLTIKGPVCLVFANEPMEVNPEERIKQLNLQLIPVVPPIANYVKQVQVGNLVYLSGHGPDKPGGGQMYGHLGKDVTIEEGQLAARLTGISMLSTLKSYIGDLNKVKRIVKVLGLVNSDPNFTQQPQVINGFSNLMVEIFGESGKHARSAVGVAALPNNISVEIEMIVELK